jgi:hypothetical protein
VVVGFVPGAHADDTKPTPSEPTASKSAASTPAASNAVPATAVDDDEFLEFLGSVDAEGADDDWLDYLSRTDIEKVAKAKKTSPDTEAKK